MQPLPPIATWDQVLYNPVTEVRPPYTEGYISFLDRDGNLRYIPLTLPPNAFVDLCVWQDFDDELFLGYRAYWLATRDRLRASDHGCKRLYNIYIPKPPQDDPQ